jgi:DNA-binding NarL/FixJ family response regulator
MRASSGGQRSKSRTDKIRLLVADDHVTVLEGLVAIIGRQPDMQVVAAASNGREAVDLWLTNRPDVTLLDLRMPILDGVGAIQEIRRQEFSARVIVLTTFDTDADLFKAIKAGAKGYLLKDAPREELLTCIRRVNSGETVITPMLVTKLTASLTAEPVTDRELEVLAQLARGSSNKEISATLNISESTVKSHLRSIFTKLNVLSRTEAIATASRQGLVKI